MRKYDNKNTDGPSWPAIVIVLVFLLALYVYSIYTLVTKGFQFREFWFVTFVTPVAALLSVARRRGKKNLEKITAPTVTQEEKSAPEPMEKAETERDSFKIYRRKIDESDFELTLVTKDDVDAIIAAIRMEKVDMLLRELFDYYHQPSDPQKLNERIALGIVGVYCKSAGFLVAKAYCGKPTPRDYDFNEIYAVVARDDTDDALIVSINKPYGLSMIHNVSGTRDEHKQELALDAIKYYLLYYEEIVTKYVLWLKAELHSPQEKIDCAAQMLHKSLEHEKELTEYYKNALRKFHRNGS